MEEKMTGAMLSAEYREKLSRVLAATKRSFRGQLETWIDLEIRLIERIGK